MQQPRVPVVARPKAGGARHVRLEGHRLPVQRDESTVTKLTLAGCAHPAHVRSVVLDQQRDFRAQRPKRIAWRSRLTHRRRPDVGIAELVGEPWAPIHQLLHLREELPHLPQALSGRSQGTFR